MLKKYIVPVKDLKNTCDANIFKFQTTSELEPLREIIGQERATRALKFGLSIKRRGYNIYVSGLTGTGRNSYTYFLTKKYARNKGTINDWCYVYNFDKPENPIALKFKAGEGRIFKNEVDNIISNLKIRIPNTFLSKEYENKKNDIYDKYHNMVEKVIDELNNTAQKYNFVFKKTDNGLVSIPLIDGRPMTEEEIEKISEEEIRKIRELSNQLSIAAFDMLKEIKDLESSLRDAIKELKGKIASEIIDNYINPLKKKYKTNSKIVDYLESIKKDIVKNLNKFVNDESNKVNNNLLLRGQNTEDFFKRYEVNLFIDNSKTKGNLVIREMNPTYYNLLGKIEYVSEMGMLKTDHTMIKPGAIHEANGGYLILQAKDVLNSKYAWEGLKRALSTEQVKIENINRGEVIAETIKPEPIPLDLKVILIGDDFTYQYLYIYDDDFKKLFKIRADFDVEMERNDKNIQKIASFIACQCEDEGLKDFDKTAVARIIEFSSRLAEDKRKLTAKFNELVEVIYEADAWAECEGEDIVTEKHVKKAIEEKIYRNNKYEEKLQELIKNDVILIDTYGKKIGEINGLAVMDSGQYSFGRPNKITVSTYAGKDGIINIEREVEQSGNIHDKGVLILSGYLGEKYAKEMHLSLSASITFEQSYDGIDGDSASSTELYALLSSLADLPINQGIAVTGSVNQKGIVQPIGGVNEKIEGYYKVCKAKGFKGGEGVIIPKKNVDNLMLNDEVIEAVKEGKFTIYAVETIDEGIEILTGVPAGELNEEGQYPEGTVNYLVQSKLEEYANINKEYE